MVLAAGCRLGQGWGGPLIPAGPSIIWPVLSCWGPIRVPLSGVPERDPEGSCQVMAPKGKGRRGEEGEGKTGGVQRALRPEAGGERVPKDGLALPGSLDLPVA